MRRGDEVGRRVAQLARRERDVARQMTPGLSPWDLGAHLRAAIVVVGIWTSVVGAAVGIVLLGSILARGMP